MEEINLREFQRNFSKVSTKSLKILKDGVEFGVFLKVGSEEYGLWKGADVSDRRVVTMSDTKATYIDESEAVSGSVKPSVGISPEKFLEKTGNVEGHNNYLNVEEPVEEMRVPEYMKCKICVKYIKDQMWEGEEDGVDFIVCEECVKRRWGVGYKNALSVMKRAAPYKFHDALALVYEDSRRSKGLPILRAPGEFSGKISAPMWKEKKEKKGGRPFNKK